MLHAELPQTVFQHTAARRRLVREVAKCLILLMFQHTAARRRLARNREVPRKVSDSFNTQPPEGGWGHRRRYRAARNSFNTQPPEGGWLPLIVPPVSGR